MIFFERSGNSILRPLHCLEGRPRYLCNDFFKLHILEVDSFDQGQGAQVTVLESSAGRIAQAGGTVPPIFDRSPNAHETSVQMSHNAQWGAK
jgi:hypothetical protein